MEEKLTFIITLVDGTKEKHDIICPAGQADAVAQQAMLQFATLGVLKNKASERKWVLIPSGRIAHVEVDIPLVATATPLDALTAATHTEGLRKIISG